MNKEKIDELITIFSPLTSLGVEALYNISKNDSSIEESSNRVLEYIKLLFNPLILLEITNKNIYIKDICLDSPNNYLFDHTKENIYDCLNIKETEEFTQYLQSLNHMLVESFTKLANLHKTVKISSIIDIFKSFIPSILESNYTNVHKSFILVKILYSIYDINLLLFNNLINNELIKNENSPSKCNN